MEQIHSAFYLFGVAGDRKSRDTCSQLAQAFFVHFSPTKYVWCPICKYCWHSVPHLTYCELCVCYHVSAEHVHPYNDYKCLGGRCQNLGTWQDGREEDDNAGARCGREQLDTSLVGFLNLDIGTVVNTLYLEKHA